MKRDDDYRAVFQKVPSPAADAFKPEFVIVSAGFDAHRDDPLASMGLTEDGYAELTAIVAALPGSTVGGVCCPAGRGYNLTALAASVERHVQVLVSRHDRLGEMAVGRGAPRRTGLPLLHRGSPVVIFRASGRNMRMQSRFRRFRKD